jgi:cation transport ATPase
MDISKLSHGAKLVIAGTIAFLIVSIFNWQEVEFEGIASAGRSMWSGWGVLAGLIAIALLVWEAIRLANINVALPVTPAMTSAALAILLLIFTVIKFLADNEFRTFWAWLGLVLAIAIVVGAWMNMQAAGESMADVKASLSSVASSAKEAVDRDDTPAATSSAPVETAPPAPVDPAPPAPAPTAPADPAPPVETPTDEPEAPRTP